MNPSMEDKKKSIQQPIETTKENSELNMHRNTSIIAFPDGSVNIAVESTPIKFVSKDSFNYS